MKQIQDLLKDKVAKYDFKPLFSSNDNEGVHDFKFSPLDEEKIINIKEKEKIIKMERKDAKRNNFNISPIVEEHRGLNRQEELERQRLIQEEVERQLVRVQDSAYQEGYARGLEEGQEEVFRQTRAEVEQKIESLEHMFQQVLKTQEDLIQNEKQTVYRTIKNLTKWVILKELDGDEDYINRLLEKLILEIQLKKNLLIRLDKNSFSNKEGILKILQEKLGEMENIRVEADYDIEGPGIVVESDNGIINGTLTEQFKSLSKLFENVGHKLSSEDGIVPLDAMVSHNEDDDKPQSLSESFPEEPSNVDSDTREELIEENDDNNISEDNEESSSEDSENEDSKDENES